MKEITLSVVSHRQNSLVNQLLEDIERVCADRVAITVTENVPDAVPVITPLPMERIVNERIKGFGANHNAAFGRCATPYFCVANPDIRLRADPFPRLLECLEDPRVAAVGPLVRSPAGGVEDSARRFPTVRSLIGKVLTGSAGPDYPPSAGRQAVDWVAGMFVLFRAEHYRAAGGFDERYFMYYEDVDICRRLAAAGRKVMWDTRAEVIHDARRASRGNLRHAIHHGCSALRFLRSATR